MNYLYKTISSNDGHVHRVVCPSNYPDRFKVITMSIPAVELDDQDMLFKTMIREAFVLEPYAEMIIQNVGHWERYERDNHFEHPFMKGRMLPKPAPSR